MMLERKSRLHIQFLSMNRAHGKREHKPQTEERQGNTFKGGKLSPPRPKTITVRRTYHPESGLRTKAAGLKNSSGQDAFSMLS
jgi:hypothetical protein